MRENDGRKLSKAAREELRIAAVKRVVENGERPIDVIKSIGFQTVCIYRWLAAYRSGGYEALKDNKNHGGRPPILGGAQMLQLYRIVADETPEQYQFEFSLWTIETVREAVRRKFGIKMSSVSAWRALKALGLNPQKPKRAACQQNPLAVKRFLQAEYPEIKKKAEETGGAVYWGGGEPVRPGYYDGTALTKEGETPAAKRDGGPYMANLLSAVCGNGKLRFMVTEEGLTQEVFIEFLKRLAHGQKGPVYLIADGRPAYTGKKVKEYVESAGGKLGLFFLPEYSPELNPDVPA